MNRDGWVGAWGLVQAHGRLQTALEFAIRNTELQLILPGQNICVPPPCTLHIPPPPSRTLQFANSCPVGSLSMRHWDQDDPNEMLGAHCFLPGKLSQAGRGGAGGGAGGLCGSRLYTLAAACCAALRCSHQSARPSALRCHFAPAGCNGRWVQELCHGLPIFYDSPVREVRHCARGGFGGGAVLPYCALTSNAAGRLYSRAISATSVPQAADRQQPGR